MTQVEIIRMIAGSDIKTEKDPQIELMFGLGAYIPHRSVIKLSDPNATNGAHLVVAAHEAFHALRHLQGERFYDSPEGLLKVLARLREERIVNNLTEEILPSLGLTEEQMEEGREFLRLSRLYYTPSRFIPSLIPGLIAGLFNKDQVREAKDWMHAVANEPGEPVGEDIIEEGI